MLSDFVLGMSEGRSLRIRDFPLRDRGGVAGGDAAVGAVGRVLHEIHQRDHSRHIGVYDAVPPPNFSTTNKSLSFIDRSSVNCASYLSAISFSASSVIPVWF